MHTQIRRLDEILSALDTLHRAEKELAHHKRNVAVDLLATYGSKLLDELELAVTAVAQNSL